MVLIMAILDMVGVVSILPFIAVLANPNVVYSNTLLNNSFQIASSWGIGSPESFLFALGVVAFFLLVISLTFKALTTYFVSRFTLMCEFSIGKRLVEGYLYQNYCWFLNHHSADLGKNVLSEVAAVISQGLVPIVNLIAQSAVTVAIFILLLLIDFKLALTVSVTLLLAYYFIFKSFGKILERIGKERLQSNSERFLVLSEAFGAIKEIKLYGLEKNYVNRFTVPARIYVRHQTAAQVIGHLPRFFLEAIAFGGMLVVVLYLMQRDESLEKVLPVMALYAVAGYRLMPAIQQIYNSLASIRYSSATLDHLQKDFANLRVDTSQYQLPSKGHAICVNESIVFNNVSYAYPGSAKPAIAGISLKISAKTKVGFIGKTGSGKTTLVDLITGLLQPKEGTLEIDGAIIDRSRSRLWQRQIGYVPQSVYLADDTIAANIAFSISDKDVNHDAVVAASKLASLHDFVVDELPGQYQTRVGERGIRLSGGQRQRIGIARALYKKPNILILDEATNSLDPATEKLVMDAVSNLGKSLTVIVITHKIELLEKFDWVYVLEEGQLTAQGSYKELMGCV
jgi:ABC-type bacteriocin/lantibiotic exporter with double-glycine peptidase domain